MYIDKELIFSENQAITTSAPSTNIIDMGDTESGGNPLKIMCRVTEDFAAAGDVNLTVALQGSSDSAFTTPTDLITASEVNIVDLEGGYDVQIGTLPEKHSRYLRLYYTVDDAFTAGKITAAIVL